MYTLTDISFMYFYLGDRYRLEKIVKIHEGDKDLEWTDWLRLGYSDGICEHGNETYGSIKGREFIKQLNVC
jgi:hypothetical protein